MKTLFNSIAPNPTDRVKNPSEIYLTYSASRGVFLSRIKGAELSSDEGQSIKFLVLDILPHFEKKMGGDEIFSFPFRGTEKEIRVWNKTADSSFSGTYKDCKDWVKSFGDKSGRLAYSIIGSYAGKPATLKLNGYALQAFFSFAKGADFQANPVLTMRSTLKQIKPNKSFETKVYELVFSQITDADFDSEKEASEFRRRSNNAANEFIGIFSPYIDSLFADNSEPKNRPELEDDDIAPVDDMPF